MIPLSPELRDRLIKLAEATGRSELTDYLGDLGDLHIADQRLALIRAGLSSPVPLEDAISAHDLEEGEVGAPETVLVAVDCGLLKQAHSRSALNLSSKEMVDLAVRQFLRV